MVSKVSGPSFPVSALVVDRDSQGRQRICEALARKGIEVKACDSLSQGREFFDAQPIVLARSPGQGPEFNGFVDWVRERSGKNQPYIVAIDDGFAEGDAMISAAANPGCNAVMATPADDRAIEERLAAIDSWLELRNGSQEPAPDKGVKVVSPFQSAPGEAAVPGDGQIAYSNILIEREQWKRREKELLEERDFFAAIPDNAQVGIVLLDREGHALYCNPQHRAILGFDAGKEADIEQWLRRGCPDDARAEEVLEVWREKIWRKQISEVLTLATGEGLLKEIRFDPTLLEDGNLLLSFADVTESRRLEESLYASEAKCRALFQGSRVGMALVDLSGDFFDVNAALESMLGLPRWEIRSKPLSAFVHPEDLANLEVIDAANAEEDRNLGEVEVRFVRKDKELVWVRLTASPVRDHDGRLLFTAYSVCDVSAQRKSRLDRREGYEQNRALLEAIPDLLKMLTDGTEDAIVLTDARGTVTGFSAASERLFGYSKREAIGKPLYTFYEPADPKGFNHRISEALVGERRWAEQTRFFHRDGREGTCEVRYLPLDDGEQGVSGLLGVTRPVMPAEDGEIAAGANGRSALSGVQERVGDM